ncbi:MAG: chemotaxis protein CheX [Deltaproteobacteria bacterium]|nr:chemotaxis protein CheX [Deltaproteobacteria bacterium]
MSTDYLSAFTSATAHVLKTMAQVSATPEPPVLNWQAPAGDRAFARIPFTGQVTGQFAIGFTSEVLFSVYKNMLGEDPRQLSPQVLDTAGEMANMICGEARKRLYSQGYHITGGIPIQSTGWELLKNTESPVFVPFSTPAGSFCIQLAIQGVTGGALMPRAQDSHVHFWQQTTQCCPIHSQPLPFMANRLDMTHASKVGEDLFLLPKAEFSEGVLPVWQQVAQSVMVCPKCMFSSSRLEHFPEPGKNFPKLFIRNEFRDELKKHLEEKMLNVSLKDIINDPARSPELARTAFVLAIISSEALAAHGGADFAQENDLLAEYALGAALMNRVIGDQAGEQKMLTLADRFLMKRLLHQQKEAEFRSLYRLAAIAIYLGNHQKGGKQLQTLAQRAKTVESLPESQRRGLEKVPRYLEMGARLWSKREHIRIGAPGASAGYSFF